MIIACPICTFRFECCAGRYNRALKISAPLYCSKLCSGLGRRSQQTTWQKKQAKSEYDRKRREEKREILRAKKRKAYVANKQAILEKMKVYRKIRMPKHLEYCMRPEYRAKKHDYDIARNAAAYGEFAETWRLLIELQKEIRSQATAYERRVANGYYTRSAKRRRETCRNLVQAT
jgi:hypothetical protein